jgi:hypothetical protein
MKNAEQIAEIAQSEHFWDLFVRSKLFVHAATNPEILDEARDILKNKLIQFAVGHPERERKEKALERLNQGSVLSTGEGSNAGER